jgi:hypothetical protein
VVGSVCARRVSNSAARDLDSGARLRPVLGTGP